jgi:GT2 family glycosyltransferase
VTTPNAHLPQISAIIPTCGRTELLLNCVASIISGNYEDYEILVIDQDPSQQLLHGLAQRFPGERRLRYFFLDRAGASSARNLGLQEARCEIVAFIDDDAVADPAWLQAIHEAFLAFQPPPALIAGRIDPIWPGKRPEWYPQEREYLLGLYNIGDELRSMPEHDQPVGANMAGLRQVILALGGFDQNLGPNYFRKRPMVTGEDALLGRRARQAGYSVLYQPRARVCHQISAAKLRRRYFLRRHFWEGVTIVTEMQSLGELGPGKRGHLVYHAKVIAKSLVLALLPNLRRKDGYPSSALRMLALSRAACSLGTIYGVLTLDALAG